jgi:lysozyme family protein
MNRNFERAVSLVLQHEGGYVDHARDPGGATNLGITIGTARRLGIDVDGDGDTDKVDIRLLKPADAAKVYRVEYWNKVRGDDLPDGLDYAVFDYAVNSGPGRAARELQRIVGVPADGEIGPVTLAAVQERNAADLVERLCDERLDFLRRLNTWDTFGKGWTSRVHGVLEHALLMAVSPAPPAPDYPHHPEPPVAPLPIDVPDDPDAQGQSRRSLPGWLIPTIILIGLAAAGFFFVRF